MREFAFHGTNNFLDINIGEFGIERVSFKTHFMICFYCIFAILLLQRFTSFKILGIICSMYNEWVELKWHSRKFHLKCDEKNY